MFIFDEALSPVKFSETMTNACFEMSNNAECWINSFGKERPTVCKPEQCIIMFYKATVQKLWHMYLFGEALSPLQFSEKNAKWLS